MDVEKDGAVKLRNKNNSSDDKAVEGMCTGVGSCQEWAENRKSAITEKLGPIANLDKVQALMNMADNDGLYYEVPMRCGADAKALKVAIGEIRVRMDKPPPREFQLATPNGIHLTAGHHKCFVCEFSIKHGIRPMLKRKTGSMEIVICPICELMVGPPHASAMSALLPGAKWSHPGSDAVARDGPRQTSLDVVPPMLTSPRTRTPG